jgi:6,7-dimethyl-8-ribityllumazine synthase
MDSSLLRQRDFRLGMLKSVHLGFYTLQPDDYRVAMSFLRAIGFDYLTHPKFATFMASRGFLTIRMPPPGEAEPAASGSDVFSAQIGIEVSNPEVVRDIAERMQLTVEASNSRSGDSAKFSVALPGKLFVHVSEKTDESVAEQGTYEAQGKRFAIVVSRFNAFITERLLAGARDGLSRSGASEKNILVVRVPGAFEIPAAARTLAASKKYDAIICLGCLLRGDTAHYDVIANEVSRGIGQSAQETGVPHAFGVLTCETLEQAIDRAGLKMGNKGFEAALSAIEMANLTRAVAASRSSGQGKGRASRRTGRQATPGRKKQK